MSMPLLRLLFEYGAEFDIELGEDIVFREGLNNRLSVVELFVDHDLDINRANDEEVRCLLSLFALNDCLIYE